MDPKRINNYLSKAARVSSSPKRAFAAACFGFFFLKKKIG